MHSTEATEDCVKCTELRGQLDGRDSDLAAAEGKVVGLTIGTERIHGQFQPLQAKLLEAIAYLRTARNLLPFLNVEAKEVKENAGNIQAMQDWLKTIDDTNANINIINQANRELKMKFPDLRKRIMQHGSNGAPSQEFLEWREAESDDFAKLFEDNDRLLDSRGELVVTADAVKDEEQVVP